MSHSGYTFRSQARLDAIEITVYIAQDNHAAAEAFLDALEATCKSIAAMPGRGSRWAYKSPALKDVRMVPVNKFDSYLIFYHAQGGGVDVIRVVHSARDLLTLFSQGVT